MSRTAKNHLDHEALQALAVRHGLSYLDLPEITVPQEVLELVPESVARENIILPLAVWDGILFVALSDPTDFDTVQKLQFILNKDIQPVLAAHEQIIESINRHYGQSETESVDSMLSEFTDTAIDFTETEALEEEFTDFDATEAPCVYSVRRRQPEPRVARQATVRYYHRINPERMYPLLVVLSRREILAVVKRNVGQAASERFEVALNSAVEVEPVLPGCSCYPPRELLTVRKEEQYDVLGGAARVRQGDAGAGGGASGRQGAGRGAAANARRQAGVDAGAGGAEPGAAAAVAAPQTTPSRLRVASAGGLRPVCPNGSVGPACPVAGTAGRAAGAGHRCCLAVVAAAPPRRLLGRRNGWPERTGAADRHGRGRDACRERRVPRSRATLRPRRVSQGAGRLRVRAATGKGTAGRLLPGVAGGVPPRRQTPGPGDPGGSCAVCIRRR